MREVCLLIGRGGAILWSDASTSPVALLDSRARWEAIWTHREELEEIVHSHPVGPLGFSAEDESTMAALCAALSKWPRFWVVAPGASVLRCYQRPLSDAPAAEEEDFSPPHFEDQVIREDSGQEPFWAALLRLASGMKEAGAWERTELGPHDD